MENLEKIRAYYNLIVEFAEVHERICIFGSYVVWSLIVSFVFGLSFLLAYLLLLMIPVFLCYSQNLNEDIYWEHTCRTMRISGIVLNGYVSFVSRLNNLGLVICHPLVQVYEIVCHLTEFCLYYIDKYFPEKL